MPVYSFRCLWCNAYKEVRLNTAERDTKKVMCPSCYAPMNRIPTAAGFVLKGKGFHQNDYPKK